MNHPFDYQSPVEDPVKRVTQTINPPYLGPYVRTLRKKIPVLRDDDTLAYESTLVVDTFGFKGKEEVVCDWGVLEELIDEVIEARIARMK